MSKTLSQRQALLVLNGLQGIGPVLLSRLMEAFESDAVAILSGQRKTLTTVKGVGDKVIDALINWDRSFNLEKEERAMAARGTRFLTQEDSEYPALLRETYDPPIGLYWQGEYTVDRPCIAIVGTRRATLYGRSVAKKFASELSRLGFCIVSGLARGTDSAAHEGALEAGGKTVAVLGCGLDIIYPPENLDLYKAISTHGAVASEFPFARRADRQTFPMRNRVVAGMCLGTVVIESDAAGGSMITARFTGEQGRQLMAVPGRIDQASSNGCHQLIRDGATLVTSADDILEELRYARPETPELDFGTGGEAESGNKPQSLELSESEAAILAALAGGEIATPDAIAERSQLGIAEVSGLLMSLELKRCVVKRADGRFEAK